MGKSRFPKPDQVFSQNLATGALSFTTTTPSGVAFHLDQIIFHSTVAISETITITVDSVKGANYDTILQEVVLVTETDYVYRPQGDAIFNAGDEIKITCSDDGGVGTVYGIVKTSEIS